MKLKTFVQPLPALLMILAFLHSAPASPATAQATAPAATPASEPGAGQSIQQATDMLTSGKWKFHGSERVFNKDGTFTSQGGANGVWSISQGMLVVTMKVRRSQFPLPLNPNGTPGTDQLGEKLVLKKVAPAAPKNGKGAPQPQATPAIPDDVQAKASAILQDYPDSLVFITGSEGSGSGFIANFRGHNYLVTNAHVAAGLPDATYTTLNGAQLQPGLLAISVGEDIFAMAMPPGGKPFQIAQDVTTNAKVGDWVVVLGNASGGGVANTIIGKVTGLGPKLVEVDAPFVPGNSGSPIIDINTGDVLGVATYMMFSQYDKQTSKMLRMPLVRRFGYRLDIAKDWQVVDRQTFDLQAARMKSLEDFTKDLGEAYLELTAASMGGSTPPVDSRDIQSQIDAWKNARSKKTAGIDPNGQLISYFATACQADINLAEKQFTYDYFTRQLTIQERERGQIEKALEALIREAGK